MDLLFEINFIASLEINKIIFSTHDVLKNQKYLTEASLRTSDGVAFSDQINILVIELNKFENVLKKSGEGMTSNMLERKAKGRIKAIKDMVKVLELLNSFMPRPLYT